MADLVAAHRTYSATFDTGECGIVSAESAEDARARFAILWPGAEITELRSCHYALTPTYVPNLEGLKKGVRRNVTHYRQERSA